MNMTSDDVLAELDEMKEVAVLDPAYVRGALACCKGLMMFVESLDEFDKSELPFTRTAILAALLDAAAQMNHPFADDLALIGDLATVCDMLHRRRLGRLAH